MSEILGQFVKVDVFIEFSVLALACILGKFFKLYCLYIDLSMIIGSSWCTLGYTYV